MIKHHYTKKLIKVIKDNKSSEHLWLEIADKVLKPYGDFKNGIAILLFALGYIIGCYVNLMG